MRGGALTWVLVGLALGQLACSSAPASLEPAPAPLEPVTAPAPPPGDFSGGRAWEHFKALTRLGPGVPGSEAAAGVRSYLAGELQALGLEVRAQTAQRVDPDSPERVLETVNLLAEVPGSSRDLIVLVAPYGSLPEGSGAAVSDDASGAALLLELARALQVRGSEYTILLAFVEGDALVPGDPDRDGAPPAVVGTEALVASLASGEGLDRVRLAVGFERVAEPDLRVARDLLSSRALREEFWSAARRQGHDAVFPATASFESVEGVQRAFVASGMRRTVAITGSRPVAITGSRPVAITGSRPVAINGSPPDAEELPAVAGSDARVAEDSSRASLGAVGEVSLDAILAISRRLAKIDRFSGWPISTQTQIDAPPEAAETAAPSGADPGDAAAP
jgi:hypothetical protein